MPARRRKSSFLAAFLLAAAFLAPPPGLPAAENAPLAERPEVAAAIQVLDLWIARTVADREQPGLSIGIVSDQDLIWSKGYGYADLSRKTPATPATAYRIASITKLFTATALLQLRDAGKLQLDDPVEKYLPAFQPNRRFPDSPTITIRHLITHTSGLPREVPGTYWNDMNFPETAEMLRLVNGEGPSLPTESEWKYSNVAPSLAGSIVEKVSGEPYAKYVERHILWPLGMVSTKVIPTADMPQLATGYGRRLPGQPRRVEPFLNSKYMTPAANFASTVEDLAKFASLQLRKGSAGGGQILRGSTLSEMHRVQWLLPDWKSGWGLGWGVRRVGDQVRIWHGGAVPGHRTQICVVPSERVAVIVLTNAEDGDPGRYVNRALEIVGPAVVRMTAPPLPTVARTEPSRSKYVGRYVWDDDENFVVNLNGELAIVDPSDENPWVTRVVLEPIGPNTFRMMTGPQEGETITFETDAAGNVTRMTMPGSYMVKAKP